MFLTLFFVSQWPISNDFWYNIDYTAQHNENKYLFISYHIVELRDKYESFRDSNGINK